MKINFWQTLNNAQLTHPLTCGINESKHAFVLKADILNTWLKLARVEKQVNSIPREHLPQLIVFHRYELNQAVPEAATICLGPLQVDNIFVFIRQVAPVPVCWLYKTSATSWPLTVWPWKWYPSQVWLEKTAGSPSQRLAQQVQEDASALLLWRSEIARGHG